MASVEGLEGVTVGRLATALNMSKAGVIGHFGNKLELQLATLDFAAEVFRKEVWQPAEHVTAGMPRLLAICASWMEYAGRPAFPGGCFIAAASFEFDSRPGPVHDALAAHMRRWHAQLVADAQDSYRGGRLTRVHRCRTVSLRSRGVGRESFSEPPTLRRRTRGRARKGFDAHLLGQRTRPPSSLA